ncbi:MAG: ABC transporter substrate-binding protein [Lewinellaceae bacterium]|nr:ABC transporter substrate-binding protein [Lewinellaceae bacterium]
MMPFDAGQFDEETNAVPEKSEPAMQFYAGAQLALQQLSVENRVKLQVEFQDARGNDTDFRQLINSGKLDKAQVLIGPMRSSQVEMLAAATREKRQILVSPTTPVSTLTQANPDFIQINPSLKSHCVAITRFVRRYNEPANVVLVCKEKEAGRLPYFQEANAALGGGPMKELILPDDATNFDKAALASYLKSGKTTTFIMPSWSSQDFVMSLLLKLNAIKGRNQVEVFGMPQWANFENIEPEYFRNLNVHLSSADYIDRNQPRIKDFEQLFFDTYGTVPTDDGFSGYDVTLFTGRMLARYGLSFPERLNTDNFEGLHAPYRFEAVRNNGFMDTGTSTYDYLENTHVLILRFDQNKFVPVE